jgi:hypothetical protein
VIRVGFASKIRGKTPEVFCDGDSTIFLSVASGCSKHVVTQKATRAGRRSTPRCSFSFADDGRTCCGDRATGRDPCWHLVGKTRPSEEEEEEHRWRRCRGPWNRCRWRSRAVGAFDSPTTPVIRGRAGKHCVHQPTRACYSLVLLGPIMYSRAVQYLFPARPNSRGRTAISFQPPTVPPTPAFLRPFAGAFSTRARSDELAIPSYFPPSSYHRSPLVLQDKNLPLPACPVGFSGDDPHFSVHLLTCTKSTSSLLKTNVACCIWIPVVP